MDATEARIVVGIDGSPGSRAALSWAMDEATLHHLSLALVHAWRPMFRAPVEEPGGPDPALIARAHGDALLAAAMGHVKVSAPTLPVCAHLLEGRPSAVLLDAAQGASMLVVGSRGLGGFYGMQLGSVGLHAVAHASCSVVVVRARERAKGPVIAGIDGSAASRQVLSVAFEEAELRRSPLVVIWALYVHPVAEGVPDHGRALAAVQAAARATVAPLVRELAQAHPRVDVSTSFPIGYPAEILANTSATGQLLVVGSHGGGGFSGMRLGSISHAVAHEAHCPLIVVRGPALAGPVPAARQAADQQR